jgi:SAM-dependent methyltransferase
VLDREIERHYAAGVERGRLAGPSLERLRTEELLDRFLPPAPADVLDVGGGPGVYAAWLARGGYRLRLVDALALHVEQARAVAALQPEAPFAAEVGDARSLAAADGSVDAVLLLGPLYHLTERADRVRALEESRRVLRPGGVLAAAAVSRFASLLDGFREGFIADPAFAAIVDRDLREGQHRNPNGREEWFTTAYFHHPDELAREVEDAGLALDAVLGLEGPGWLFAWDRDDPAWLEAALKAARAVEAEPALRAVSAHLFAVARRVS